MEWYENSLRFPQVPSLSSTAVVGDGTTGEFVDPVLHGLESWDPERRAGLLADTGAAYGVRRQTL